MFQVVLIKDKAILNHNQIQGIKVSFFSSSIYFYYADAYIQ